MKPGWQNSRHRRICDERDPCSLNRTVTSVATRRPASWQQLAHAIDGYAIEIIRLIGESYGPQTLQQAWAEFSMGRGTAFHADNPHAELFLTWTFHQWAPSRERGHDLLESALYGVSPTRAYLDRQGSGLDPLLKRYLETCLMTAPRFYEVRCCKPYVGLELCDALTGAECEVWDERASATVRSGEIIFTRLVSIDEITVIDAISPVSFPLLLKEELTRLPANPQSGEPGESRVRGLYFGFLESQSSMPIAAQEELVTLLR